MLKEGKVLICVFFLAFILYYGFNKKAFLPIGINLFCAFGFLIVFSYLGRMMLRVWEPTLLCMMGAIIVLFGNMRANDIEREYEIQLIYNPRDRKKTRYRSFLKFTVSDLFLGLLCCIIFLGSINVFSDLKSLSLPTYDVDRDEITRARAEFIDASRDEIYLLFFPLIHHPPQPGTFGLWEPLPADYCPNYFALTNWDATTPTNINRLKAYGIGNPVKALFERDDTYSDYDRNVFDFIRHHYGENITCSKVKNFKDEGLIVQYSQPILKENIKENVKSQVEIVKDEYLVYGGENGFHIKGSLDVKEDMDIKALYCNVQSEDGILSYRLNWSEERFEGIFLDVEDGSLDNQELYLVGKTENGEYFQLGDIELESRE